MLTKNGSVAPICFVFASAFCSPFGWACFLLGLNFGSCERGMVCGTDGLQACGKPDLSFPGLSSLCFMVLAGLNLPHWGVFPWILLLAQLQCCSQLLSGYTVLLSFGEAASMVRAGRLRMVTQLCHSPCGFLHSLPRCYCKNRQIFPYDAAVLQCVSQGLTSEVLVEGRRPAR